MVTIWLWAGPSVVLRDQDQVPLLVAVSHARGKVVITLGEKSNT